MNACVAFNGLFIDVIGVMLRVFEVGGLENVVKDFECVESAAEMCGHPKKSFFREFGINRYV
jgi:hypothetical protein